MAGDQLVLVCPTWSWSTGKIKNKNLPDDKQFLITRNVPCNKRIKDIISDKILTEREGDDGWVEAIAPLGEQDAIDISKENEKEELIKTGSFKPINEEKEKENAFDAHEITHLQDLSKHITR